MAKKNADIDNSTEDKIKEAAKIVFHKKGFSATRTRDIAKESGINLALINYYFRSKSKLFEIVMLETMITFFQKMITVLNDENTTFKNKIETFATEYIDLISKNPEIPTFLISEIRNNPKLIIEKISIKEILLDSVFFKQHTKAVENGEIGEHNPLHFLLNILGLVVFPFISKPMITYGAQISETDFDKLMQERKKMIPIWMGAMFKKQ